MAGQSPGPVDDLDLLDQFRHEVRERPFLGDPGPGPLRILFVGPAPRLIGQALVLPDAGVPFGSTRTGPFSEVLAQALRGIQVPQTPFKAESSSEPSHSRSSRWANSRAR